MARSKSDLRLGQPVRVTRQSAEKAKLAVHGYDHHQHFGDDGVVTDVRPGSDDPRIVVRFDDYGRDAVTYRPDELELV
ncbi:MULTISPECIES: hypothetical protein [unclassified Halobacterium]|jgi:hypothetical protein|uniref:hypothetical protein n=1 Tax=unclassified Halobacterium TaxID=2668073 RepID=UPI001E29A894|nr:MULTISPECIES: hypothetical protein [unclassified Halobacterium]MCD2199588.1 hypothetical protein [Halobacterium sp. KA-4]MCD2203518.1 hypothetical protein [Halobacterium sp. KA-6]